MQNILKYYLLIVVSIAFYSNIYAQTNAQYGLLWQIEGENLTEPSYLFGTMHVKDKRAFNFSDSVMTSIQQCDIFALEVNPDSMVGAMFDVMFDADTTNYLAELLSDEEYQKFKKRFEEKTGFQYDNLKSKSPMLLESMLQPDYAKPDDKQTFVDAYLFGIAKTMNKKITGLEDLRTQIDMFSVASKEEQKEMAMGVLKYDSDIYKGYYNEMAELYSSGNIENMQRFLGEEAVTDATMISRNNVMANSIARLSAEGRLFAAVGVAHLWGEQGVIELLRAKGYKLSPVKATFTGVADRYKIDVSKMEWMRHKDDNLGFSIETPGRLFPIDMAKLTDDAPMKMMMYPDISTETNFAVMTMDLRILPEGFDTKTIIDTMVESFKKKSGSFKKKKINKSGTPAVEIFMKEASGKASTIQLIVEHKMLHVLFVEGKKQELKQPYIKRFFNSYQNFEPVYIPQVDTDWITYENEEGAFSVLLPGEPKDMTREVANPIEEGAKPFIVNMYMSADVPNLMNYLITYNDYPLGYYLDDRAGYFELITEELEAQGSKLVGEIDTIFVDGIEGRRYDVVMADTYFGEFYVFMRGNRAYKIIRQNLNTEERTMKDDDFFKSFSFIPHKASEFETFEPEGEHFKINQFALASTEVDSTIDYESYFGKVMTHLTTNPHTGGVYTMEAYELDEYFKMDHIDSFYNTYTDNLLSWNDSIRSTASIQIGGKPGREVFAQNNTTQALTRLQIWLDNDRFYYISAYSDEQELFNETSNAYFKSFQKTGENTPLDYYASKAEKILTGLLSTDTLAQQKSLGAFGHYVFTAEDLPLLYKAATHTYHDDTLYNGAKCKIIENIAYIDDETSIDEFKALYPKLNNIGKNTVLLSLLDFSEDKGQAAMLDLLLNNPPKELKWGWAMLRPVRDSLELAAQHFGQFLPLVERESYRSNILSIATSLMEADTMPYTKLVENAFDQLTKFALADIQTDKKTKEADDDAYYYSSTMDEYLNLMRQIKGKKISDEYTKQVLSIKDLGDYQMINAITVRLINGFKTDKRRLKKLTESMDTRYQMIEAYDSAKQLDRVPAKYRTPLEIAKLCLRDYLYQYSDYPDKMTLLGDISHEGSKIYVFKYTYKSEQKTDYIGLVGPFTPNSTDIDYKKIKAYSGWAELKEDWKTQAKTMLEDFEEYGY